ncbi:hypothetical protein [Algoriphagus aestuariicola]
MERNTSINCTGLLIKLHAILIPTFNILPDSPHAHPYLPARCWDKERHFR